MSGINNDFLKNLLPCSWFKRIIPREGGGGGGGGEEITNYDMATKQNQ